MGADTGTSTPQGDGTAGRWQRQQSTRGAWWTHTRTPTLPRDVVGDVPGGSATPDVACPIGVYSITGPMFSGKSTCVVKVGQAYCEAGWGIVVARHSSDNRDGDHTAHIETHGGMASPHATGDNDTNMPPGVFNVRASSFSDLAIQVQQEKDKALAQGICPAKWVVLVDEGQFFMHQSTRPAVCSMWALAKDIGGHVWIACLNLDSNLKTWAPTRDLAMRSVWTRALLSRCAVPECGHSAPFSACVVDDASVQRSLGSGLDGGDNYVNVDNKEASKYEPRCASHMPLLWHLWHREDHVEAKTTPVNTSPLARPAWGQAMTLYSIAIASVAVVVGYSLARATLR